MGNFSIILTNLKAAIAVVSARERGLSALLVIVWGRLSRMVVRMERLIALWRAGTLPKARASRAGRTCKTGERVRLPTGPAWLLDYVREAGGFGAQIESLLTQEEFAAFVAAVPQAGRVLRPLCRMLGVGVRVARAPVPQKVWGAPVVVPMVPRGGLAVGWDGRFFWV